MNQQDIAQNALQYNVAKNLHSMLHKMTKAAKNLRDSTIICTGDNKQQDKSTTPLKDPNGHFCLEPGLISKNQSCHTKGLQCTTCRIGMNIYSN